MPMFPAIRIGTPLVHEGLTVFPLFTEPNGQVDYRLTDEAMEAGLVTVQEVSEGGSVPDLLVENRGNTRVLFIEGEELVGAKQNRIINTSVLIAASSKTRIPVSCVEHGRWSYKSRHFGSSGSHSPSKLRHALKASVAMSLKSGGGHRSDQSRVWKEVADQQATLGVASGTGAMSDSFAAYKQRMSEFIEQLQYREGASGLAVAIGGKVAAVDLFDKPTTCNKVWRRLLTGFVLDALEAPADAGQVEVASVENLLNAVRSSAWEQVAAVGEGEEYRLAGKDEMHASALTLGESLVHSSVVMAV